MTATVRRLLDQIASLPDERQDAWAETWLHDLSTDDIENQIVSGTRPLPPKLLALLDEANEDIAAGRTRSMEELFD